MPAASPAWTVVAAAAFLLLSSAPLAEGAPTDADRVARALAWLAAQELPTGSFISPYVVEAVAQAGLDPKAWPPGAPSAWDRVAPSPPTTTDSFGPYKSNLRIAYAAAVAGYDPRDVEGFDAVAAARDGYVGGQFGDPRMVNDDMWAILALRAAGEPLDTQTRTAVANLLAARAKDGGWSSNNVALVSSADMTGMALAALAAADENVVGDAAASAFLDTMRNADGSYRADAKSAGANCQATVWALHARHLLGEPDEPRAWDALRGLQAPDGGFRTRPDAPSNLMCTLEALPLLAGAHHPFPAFSKGAVHAPALVTLAPATLQVEGPFTRASWLVDGARHDGTSITLTFTQGGAHAYALLAEGPGVRFRLHGELVVESRPPVARVEPAQLHAWRHERITLDPAASTDPDGRVLLARVEWGDGHVTEQAPGPLAHAYATPGNWTARVRVQDDAGLWSEAARVAVRVENRAPVFDALPPLVVADRTAPPSVAPRASDPDGDPVRLAWRMGNASGEGARLPTPTTLGENLVTFIASDDLGAQHSAQLTLRVVNLPPQLAPLELPATVAPGERVSLTARASDPDGDSLLVSWTVDGAPHEGPSVDVVFAEGEHRVEALVTDAEGATTRASATLVVDAAPDAAAPLRLGALRASLIGGILDVHVDAPSDATARVAWQTDAGAGEAPLVDGRARIPLPDATYARLRAVAERAGQEASVEAYVVAQERESPRVATTEPAASTPSQTGAADRNVSESATDEAPPAPEPDGGSHAPLAPIPTPALGAQAVSAAQAPRAEAPAPWWGALAALAAASRFLRRGTP